MDIYENMIRQCNIINFVIDEEGTIIDTNIYAMSLLDIYDMKGRDIYSLMDSMSQLKVKSYITEECREPFFVNFTASSGEVKAFNITCSRVNGYIAIMGMVRIQEEALSEQLKGLNQRAGFGSSGPAVNGEPSDGQDMRMWQINNIDALTGLYNKRFFNSMYEGWYENIKYSNTNPGIIMIKINNSKMLNDRYIVKKSDSILAGLSQIILSCIRSSDYPVRYDDDEFLILLNNVRSSTVVKIAERIKQSAISELGITISVGCTSFDTACPMSKEEFVKQAMDALRVSGN